jgi:hypothetical protein
MLEQLVAKMHVRSAAVLIGAFFAVVGVIMIFHGIRDEGFIDLQSALVNGKVKTGLVGVTCAFLGAVVVVACVLTRPTLQKLKVKKGDASIEWEGVGNDARALLVQMESMAKVLYEDRRGAASEALERDAP